MKNILNYLALSIFLTIFVISNTEASTPQIVIYRTQQEFQKGTPKGVSINSYGELFLAPQIEELYKTELPFLWSGVTDRLGNMYVAGGNGGKIFRIDSKNSSSLFFEIEESQIYSLAVDNKNNLYVASSPEGKVYKVPNNKEVKPEDVIFFDPEELYIWSLAIDEQNNLFVATGEKGNIYKVDQLGTSALFYEGEDSHIRKIILDDDGNLFAGTSGKGMVLKISSDGNPFVLYDSPLTEITSLLLGKTGNVYAAAAGGSQLPLTAPRPQSKKTAKGNGTQEPVNGRDEALDLPIQPLPPVVTSARLSGKSALYRINNDGTVNNFWTSKRDRIYTMVIDNSDNIILGTGKNGRLYSMNYEGEPTLLTQLDEMQITAIGKDTRGEIYLCTSNAGKVFRMQKRLSEKGHYLSEAFDASVPTQWGSISWESELRNNSEIVVYTRSGNTEEPDKTWSDWSGEYSVAEGQVITSPPARFLQWKVEFTSKNGKSSSTLKELSFSYLQKNVAPKITEIKLLPPGDYYPESTNQSDSQFRGGNRSGKNGFQNQSYGHKSYRKGFQSVSWTARDNNGDDLSFKISYKGESERNWKTLVEKFKGTVYSWDSELMPDGRYFINIEANDIPSNPPAFALLSSKVSQPFIIDNSGPAVSKIRVKKGDETIVTFDVKDALMNVKTVEFGLNADDWKLVYPRDGICDSKKEVFEIKIDSAAKGTNTIVIKATDSIGNPGFGKMAFDL